MAEREFRWQGITPRPTYDYVVTALRDRDRVRELLKPRVDYAGATHGSQI